MRPAIKSQAGFTLIELMVAGFLGILLLFGLTQIFSSSREGARLQTAMASVQTGGRLAMEFLARDIRSADFSGCLRNQTDLYNGLNTAGIGYLQFYGLGGVSGTIAAANDKYGGKDLVEDTATLQLVSAKPACESTFTTSEDQTAADDVLTLPSACSIDNGTALLVSNCDNGDVFIKTGGASGQGTTGDDETIAHATGAVAGVTATNISADFSTLYQSGSLVLAPYVRTYFISDDSGNGNPALFRAENGKNYELVPNVTNFEVLYGVDADRSGAVELWQDANAVADFSSVVSVRVMVTVQSDELVNGAPITRTYTSTSTIRNRLSIDNS